MCIRGTRREARCLGVPCMYKTLQGAISLWAIVRVQGWRLVLEPISRTGTVRVGVLVSQIWSVSRGDAFVVGTESVVSVVVVVVVMFLIC